LAQASATIENVSKKLDKPSKQLDSRIVNGLSAVEYQFPHQAVILIETLKGWALCGGSLLNSLWVMSAAHCVIDGTSAELLFGSVDVDLMTTGRYAVEVHYPKTYGDSTSNDDISLIKVDSAIPFSKSIKPIQLPSKAQAADTYVKTVLIVSGFGKMASKKESTILQYTEVIGISDTECKKTYGNYLTPSILCTNGYANKNQGSCSGDSGGPLITKGNNSIVVGIVSFGSAQSCTNGLPAGYTRVGKYLDFIASTTGIPLRDK